MLDAAGKASEGHAVNRAILAILAMLTAGVLVDSSVSSPAIPDNPPTRAQLKYQIAVQKNRIADLNDKIDTRDATIRSLRARDPIDEITALSPDGLWASMRAIWAVFPATPGVLCGYDKSNAGSTAGVTLDSYTFYRWSAC